jgi:ribosomal protein S18 acetylase RimI-like enzyme
MTKMPDMLVKLYRLPDANPLLASLKQAGIEIRRAAPAEKGVVSAWVRQHFQEFWGREAEAAIENRPVTCLIAALRQSGKAPDDDPYALPFQELIGFACYDVAARGLFGPTGVRPDYRGRAIGKALLLATLHAMRAERYAYAVIHWVGPQEFYARAVGATVIEDSEPGIFDGFLI